MNLKYLKNSLKYLKWLLTRLLHFLTKHCNPQTASSEAVEVENEPFPTVEIEEIEEVEEMPEVASGFFNPVEEAVSLLLPHINLFSISF